MLSQLAQEGIRSSSGEPHDTKKPLDSTGVFSMAIQWYGTIDKWESYDWYIAEGFINFSYKNKKQHNITVTVNAFMASRQCIMSDKVLFITPPRMA